MNATSYTTNTLSSILKKMQSITIVIKAIQRLENTLPEKLYYHSVYHTKRVIKKAIEFAFYENTNQRDIEVITISAAYHDTGFTVRYEKNEEIGASMAMEAMKKTDAYTEREIETVEKMIMSTEVVTTNNGFERISKTQLAKYLLDADLSIFGDRDFLNQSELLRRERSQDYVSFYKETSLILKDHFWFTKAASGLLNKEKEKNISKLEKFIDKDHLPIS
jgi:predicted metal-dependent HD superfamily phosphohydrolase